MVDVLARDQPGRGGAPTWGGEGVEDDGSSAARLHPGQRRAPDAEGPAAVVGCRVSDLPEPETIGTVEGCREGDWIVERPGDEIEGGHPVCAEGLDDRCGYAVLGEVEPGLRQERHEVDGEHAGLWRDGDQVETVRMDVVQPPQGGVRSHVELGAYLLEEGGGRVTAPLPWKGGMGPVACRDARFARAVENRPV